MKRVPITSFHPVADEPRVQVGALCWRQARGDISVLLVTSRETGRWVIPKGWPIGGLSPEASAAREAWEEAGVRGEVGCGCLGVFAYDKVIDHSLPGPPTLACIVSVYPLRVTQRNRSFPEASERRLRWFSREKASRKVDEPALRAMIATFDPAAAVAAAPPAATEAAPRGAGGPTHP